jgi:hypothetical protein
MWIPLAAVAVFVLWRWNANRQTGTWTPERRALYRFALSVEREPGRINKVASYFQREGFPAEALALRQRVHLPSIAGERRDDRARLMRAALASRRPDGVRALAAGFECLGYGASSDALRSWARGLELARMVPGPPPVGFRPPPWGPSASSFGIGTVIPLQYPGMSPGSGAVPPPPPAPSDGSVDAGIGTVIPSTYQPSPPPPVSAPASPDLTAAAAAAATAAVDAQNAQNGGGS